MVTQHLVYHFSADGHLGPFLFGAVLKNVVLNMPHTTSVLPVLLCMGVKLQDSVTILGLIYSIPSMNTVVEVSRACTHVWLWCWHT